MTDKELNKIAELINERVTFAELEEFTWKSEWIE